MTIEMMSKTKMTRKMTKTQISNQMSEMYVSETCLKILCLPLNSRPAAPDEIYCYESLICYGKVLLLVIHTSLEKFYQDLYRKALLLIIPTLLEIFYHDLYRKALVLVIPTVLEIF